MDNWELFWKLWAIRIDVRFLECNLTTELSNWSLKTDYHWDSPTLHGNWSF